MTERERFGVDADYLRDKQYKDPTNLNARISLHARFARADVPWYPWLAGRVEWPVNCDVLEVGCGPGLLWVNIAPLLPHLRLTLTDLSQGMIDAARDAVEGLGSIEVVAAKTCDVQALPFPDASFDVLVANHMLYHVPEPAQAIAEFARVLRPDGVLMAATNGPNHLDFVVDVSRQVFGWSASDFVARRFGRSSGAAILAGGFGEVEWHEHPSTLVCDDPAAVIAFLLSSPGGQEASSEQLTALEEVVEARFEAAGGVVTMMTDAGCFIARRPARGRSA